MTALSRQGVLWRTVSPAQTQDLAHAACAKYVTSVDELPPGGAAVLDLDVAPLQAAIDVVRRSRALGVRLAVAARPGASVPDEVRLNLRDGT